MPGILKIRNAFTRKSFPKKVVTLLILLSALVVWHHVAPMPMDHHGSMAVPGEGAIFCMAVFLGFGAAVLVRVRESGLRASYEDAYAPRISAAMRRGTPVDPRSRADPFHLTVLRL